MRDLEKYDELSPPVIRRVHRHGPGDETTLMYTILWRLLSLVILLGGLGYLIWSAGNTQNSPLSSQEMSQIKTNRDIVRRDAERAAKSLGEDMDEETKVMKLIGNRQIDPFFPLLEKDRRLIHKYWGHITEGLTHREIARLMTILDMRYDQDGNVVDIPLEERNAAQKEANLREGTKRDTEIAIEAFLDAAQDTQANKYDVDVKQENLRRDSRDAYKKARKEATEAFDETEDLLLLPGMEDVPSGQPAPKSNDGSGLDSGAQLNSYVDDVIQSPSFGANSETVLDEGQRQDAEFGLYGGQVRGTAAAQGGNPQAPRRPMTVLERQAEWERSLQEDMPTSEDLNLP